MNPTSAGHPRILSTGDDPVLGAYAREHLGSSGFDVTWYQNGHNAVARQAG